MTVCHVATVLAATDDVEDPAVSKAVQRAVNYLKNNNWASYLGPGTDSLMAYALLKAGERPESATIVKVIDEIQSKLMSGGYKPQRFHRYEAGVDLMALEAADPQKYIVEMQAIADYLIGSQTDAGVWDYPDRLHGGDTSITQYALLGLWAASRAGINVPIKTWDRAAAWHLKWQNSNGGFGYHPASNGKEVTHSMTVAGAGNMLITKMFLRAPDDRSAIVKKMSPRDRVFGILDSIDFAASQKKQISAIPSRGEKSVAAYRPRIRPSSLESAAQRADDWLSKNFTVKKPLGWPIYYLYGLERYAALSGQTMIGGHDWYAEGAAHLLDTQRVMGGQSDAVSWRGRAAALESTSFAVLFLIKATSKLVPQTNRIRPIRVGEGLLIGGRGLPDDLSVAETKDGKVTAKKMLTPLDELLAELEKPQSVSIGPVQSQIVHSIQIGSREELIGKKELLLKLAKEPRSEIRRTAVWALGRCDDIRVTPVLIGALQDESVGVMVEARNALCTLSRKPTGFNRYRTVMLKVKKDGKLIAERIVLRNNQQSLRSVYELHLSQLKLQPADKITIWLESGVAAKGTAVDVKSTVPVSISVFPAATLAVVQARLDADLEQAAIKQNPRREIIALLAPDKSLNMPVNGIVALLIQAHNPDFMHQSPLLSISKDATEDQRVAAIENWAIKMVGRWRQWYWSVRPYDERDDLEELRAR